MKKLFYVLFGITVAFGMLSCGKDDPYPRGGGGHGGGGGQQPQDETYRFTANDVWAGYYGDAFGFGNGVYLIQLIDGTVDNDGNLTDYGNALTLAVSADILNNLDNITIPVNTYTANKSTSSKYAIFNSAIDGTYNTFLEVWSNGENQSSYYFVDKGTLTVERNGTNYKLTADLEVYYLDDNNNSVSAGKVQATYNGGIYVEDCYTLPDPYEQITSDVTFGQIKYLSGDFYYLTKKGLGNYLMHMTNCKIDKDGYFQSAGNLLTLDIYTDYTSEPDIKQISGVYKVAGLEEFEENTYQPGLVYLTEDNQYAWWGSYVDEIARFTDENGVYYDYGRAAMITGGTVNASNDGKNLHLEIDLVTETGNHVTGTYDGAPEFSNEGALDWSKARKVKNARRDEIMPFSKYRKTRKASSIKSRGIKL